MSINPSAPTIVTLTPNPGSGYTGNVAYSAVKLALIGDAKFSQSSGSGGWQIVDRPKTAAATQWFDRAPWQITFEAYLDKTHTEGAAYSGTQAVKPGAGLVTQTNATVNVEDYCNQLKLWMDPVPGVLQPPVLSIDGPIPEAQSAGGDISTWVLYNVEFNEAIRDSVTGYRMLQKVSITLYEYLPPLLDMYENYGITPTSVVMQSIQSSTANGSSTKKSTATTKSVPVDSRGMTMQQFLNKYKVSKQVVLDLNPSLKPSQFRNIYSLHHSLKIPA